MKTLSLLALAFTAGASFVVAASRDTPDIENDWRFALGDRPGAEAPSFDDRAWKVVSVPHDWSIAGPVDPKAASGRGGGYFPTGIGWYRKAFILPGCEPDTRVSIEFDGVMANSDVWINGHLLGHRPYGYIGFAYDLTPYLNSNGTPNVIAVRADDASQPASRWYPGAGIYRHVRLFLSKSVHLAYQGTVVTTPKLSSGSAAVRIAAEVSNDSIDRASTVVTVRLLGSDGRLVGSGKSSSIPLKPGATAIATVDIEVEKPSLWDIDHPSLYRAEVGLATDNGGLLDSKVVTFGIRSARFEADTGFWLNGRNLKLKGVCLHDDVSAFGAAVPLDAWKLRLQVLKDMGANAIRTAHNPPAPEFLDLCDEMGFLVMDENFDCWTVGKNPFDYHLAFSDWSKRDERDMVRRDRNHPSIILWSAGNEIHDTPNAELAKEILKGLVEVYHESDPTRPVTQALFRPNVSHDYEDGLSDLLDVVGTNYRHAELLAAHTKKPSIKIVGTENRHDLESWLAVRDHAAYSGEFIWSGFDYLGEARDWPAIASDEGLFDRTDLPRADGMIVRSWWNQQPMVWAARRQASNAVGEVDPGYGPLATTRRQTQVLFADWSPKNTSPHDERVEVYSNCPSVELILNGISLGAQSLDSRLTPRVWTVPYAPGALRAVGRDGGQVAAEAILRTAGAPVRIRLVTRSESISPGWDHVLQVRAEVLDGNGVIVPSAGNEVTFTVEGPGVLAAVDSADNDNHELFQGPNRQAFQGRCVAYLRATGTGMLKLLASAPGLAADSIQIPAEVR